MLLCDVILQFGVFLRVLLSKRCADNGNCRSSSIQSGAMGGLVDSVSQTGHYSKFPLYKLLGKPFGPSGTFLGWLAASNYREPAHFAQFPRTLIVE